MIKRLLSALAFILIVFLHIPSVNAASFSPASSSPHFVSKLSVTVSTTTSGAVGFKYTWDENKNTDYVTPKTQILKTSSKLTAPSRQQYLHVQELKEMRGNRLTNLGTQVYSGPYRVDGLKPGSPGAVVNRGAGGRVRTSASWTAGWVVNQSEYGRPQEVELRETFGVSYSGNTLTVNWPGTFYFNAKVTDGVGHTYTNSLGPYTIGSGEALTGKVLGAQDYGGSGVSRIDANWSTVKGSSVAAPPPPLPTISANPSSRGWSQDPLSVSVLFNNASSCIASWSDGSGSLSSNGTLSKSLGLGYGGSWNIVASASGPGGSVSNTFGPYRIDRKSPTVGFSPESGYYVDNGKVGISFWDEHSGVKRVRYVWSNARGDHPAWSWLSRSGNTVNESVNLPGYGTWYLHAEVEDNVGLTAYHVGGPYLVTNELETPPHRRWVYIEE